MRIHYLLILLLTYLIGCETPTEKSTKNDPDVFKRVDKYASGEVLSITYYKNKKREGPGQRFYRNGNVQMEALYVQGLKQGEGKYYYESGKLYRINHYADDQLHGLQEKYRESGELMSRQEWHKGFPSIHLEEYNRNGKKRQKYPEIQMEVSLNDPTVGYFSLRMYFENLHKKDEFYLGQLLEGQYVHKDLDQVGNNEGKGVIVGKLPTEGPLLIDVDIIGVHNTEYNNKFVRSHQFRYSSASH
jgi:hypothetical protein